MDRNAYSFNGDAAGNVWLNDQGHIATADQPGIRTVTILHDALPLPGGQDTLKFSGVRRLRVVIEGVVEGGTEDCVDFNNGCSAVEVVARGGFRAGGKYVATIKGNCDGITIRGEVIGHGAACDVDLDNYSDQSHSRSSEVHISLTAPEPVTWRSWRGVRPTLLPGQAYRCRFCLPAWLGLLVNGALQVWKRLHRLRNRVGRQVPLLPDGHDAAAPVRVG